MSAQNIETGQNNATEKLNYAAPEIIASSSQDMRRITQINHLEPLRTKVPIEYLDDTRYIRDALTSGDITIAAGQESKVNGALKILLNRLGYYDGGANGYSTVANQALVDAWKNFKEKCSLGGGSSLGITSYEKLLREVVATGDDKPSAPIANPKPLRTESAIEKLPGVELHRPLPDQNSRHNQNAEQIRRMNPQATSIEYVYSNGTEAYVAKVGNQYKVYRDLPVLSEVGTKNHLLHTYTVEVNPSSHDVKITTLLSGSNVRTSSFTGNSLFIPSESKGFVTVDSTFLPGQVGIVRVNGTTGEVTTEKSSPRAEEATRKAYEASVKELRDAGSPYMTPDIVRRLNSSSQVERVTAFLEASAKAGLDVPKEFVDQVIKNPGEFIKQFVGDAAAGAIPVLGAAYEGLQIFAAGAQSLHHSVQWVTSLYKVIKAPLR